MFAIAFMMGILIFLPIGLFVLVPILVLMISFFPDLFDWLFKTI